MNSNTIKRVIADQAEETLAIQSKDLVERQALHYAQKFLDEKIIKVISGVRRCGKSTFCHQLLESKKYLYLNFDDERLLGATANDLDGMLELALMQYPEPDYLLFDEIQNIYGWELFINRLSRQGANIIITGSNSKMLSRELATHLTGRHIQFELFPFSFREFLALKKEKINTDKPLSTKNSARVRALLGEYIELGGFPEIVNLDNKKRYLRDLFDKIILRDIAERYNVREITALKEMAIILLNNFGLLFTFNKMKNLLEMASVNTVKEFAGYLEDTYLLAYTQRYSFKIQEEVRSPRKIYCIDTGLLTALSSSLSPNIGRKMENLVFLHEKRKGNLINYYSDGKCEIDFVVKNDRNEITLIQVAKDISEPSVWKRETEALARAVKALNPVRLMLINEDKDETITIDGNEIEIIPLHKYLLS